MNISNVFPRKWRSVDHVRRPAIAFRHPARARWSCGASTFGVRSLAEAVTAQRARRVDAASMRSTARRECRGEDSATTRDDDAQARGLAMLADTRKTAGSSREALRSSIVARFSEDESLMETFGPVLSIVDALERMYEEYSVTSTSGTLRIRALGASDAFELARWRTFAALAVLLENCERVEVEFIGPTLRRLDPGVVCEATSTDGSGRLRIQAIRGLYPEVSDVASASASEAAAYDVVVAFNAGLPVGGDWARAIERIVSEHVDAFAANAPSLGNVAPPFWVSDYNEEAIDIAFAFLRHVVQRVLESRNVDSRAEAIYLEPYSNAAYQSRKRISACTVPAHANAYACAFVGLSRLEE